MSDDPLSTDNLNEIDDMEIPPMFNIESDNNKFLCLICNKPTLLCCNECQQAFYCSIQHQKQNWKFHQMECGNKLSRQQSNDFKGYLHPNISYVLKDKSPKKSFEKIEKEGSQTKIEDLRIDKLVDEREKERKEIIIMFSQNQYSQAIIKCRNLIGISKKILENNLNKKNELKEFFDYSSDHLLLVKSLVKCDKMTQARESLLLLMPLVNLHINDQKIDYQKLKESDKLNDNISKELKLNADFDNNITFQKRFLLNNELKKRTNLLSVLASLFYAVGDYKNCEATYVKYIRLVENNYGNGALEISNCYFLIGVFYLQHRFHTKALACFKISLDIRSQLGDKHESLADCWYNMGVVYKQTNKKFKAIKYLEKALTLRKELIGEISLPCAQVLETLGKIFLEAGDYKAAFMKFQDCYNIRNSILHNPKNPDLIRISLLILHLQTTIKEDVNVNNSRKNQEILLNVNNQITNSSFMLNSDPIKADNFEKSQQENPISNITMKDSIINPAPNPKMFMPKNENLKSGILLKKNQIPEENEEENVFINKKNKQKSVKLDEAGNKPDNSRNNYNEINKINVLKPNFFDLNVDKDFLASLSTDQLMKLTTLKTIMKENQQKKDNYNPNDDVLSSEFIKSLNGLQYSVFVEASKPSIDAFNKRNKNNFDSIIEKEEIKTNNQPGVLKLNDIKKI